ncbi:repetative protein [Actinosynnema sp. ALI-1.44]|nr:repetative protein [Actinosynnema sp. ALI-1.44]
MRAINLPVDTAGHSAPVTHIAFRSDGRRLATCSYDGSVLIWDTSEPARPAPLDRLRHRRLVNGSAWNPVTPALLATASADKTVALWQVPDQGPATLVNVLARHTDDINSVAWMPDGKRLICVSEDGHATMWDAAAGALLRHLSSHAAHCMMVAVNRHGLVATVGEDGMVATIVPDTTDEPRTRHYASSIEGCSWSRSGAMLAVARDDGAVDLLTADLTHIRTIEVSTSAARTVDWAEDDASFVVGAYDGSVHVFDIAGRRLHRYHDARMWPRSVATAAGLVAVGSFWGGPHLLGLDGAVEIAGPPAATYGPNALVTAGSEILVGTDAGVVVGATASGRPGGSPRQLAEGPILSLAADGENVYAGTYSGHVIRAADGEVLSSDQLDAPVPSLVVAGRTIVAGTYNGELIALDPDALTVRDRWTAHSGSVKSLAVLDGADFLSASTDRTVTAGSFRKRAVLWQHGNLVNAVSSLDGRVIASASRDHTVKVGQVARDDEGTWRVRNTVTLLGADESVKCVCLLGDPDRPLVLAGSYDFGLHLWRLNWADSTDSLVTGRVLETFSQGVSCMARIDAERVAVAGWDGRVIVVGRVGADEVGVLWSHHITDLVRADTAAVR